ncbi:MAG: hypothetical protein AAFY31_00620 [Pseudomonadota bacterium]
MPAAVTDPVNQCAFKTQYLKALAQLYVFRCATEVNGESLPRSKFSKTQVLHETSRM